MAGGETYLVLADGSIVGPTNPMPMSGTNVFSTDVAIHDASTATQHLAIDANGRIRGETAEPTFNHGQAVTGTNGAFVQVIGSNANRRFVRIKNVSAHTVYIGHTNAVTTSTGYPLAAGGSEDFPTTSALFAVSAATGDGVGYAEFTD